MDKREETTRIVKSLNDFDKGIIHDSEFIKRVCNYYDLVKDDFILECQSQYWLRLNISHRAQTT